MANVTQGLFGFDPAHLSAQREEALQAQVAQRSRLSPLQNARGAMFRAGSQVGGGVATMLGIKDPELEAQSLISQTAATLDLNDPTAVRGVANQWLQSGNPTLQNKALKLNEVADKAEETANQRTKDKIALELSQRKAANQQAFAKEYASAPDADARLAVTRKYAEMPELIKLDEAALARKEKAAEASTARAEKAEARREEQAAKFEHQVFLAGEGRKTRASASNDSRLASQSLKEQAQDLKATALQEKVNNTNEKAADADAKASRAAKGSVTHSTQMIADAEAAKLLVKFETTGRTGQAAAAVNPGGEAGTLRNRIVTMKANLGFDRLQKMRDESPTGGALGQVAVQELEALQASVASLSPLQNDVELTASFDKIVKHYDGWRKTVIEDEKERTARRASKQSINIPNATPRNDRNQDGTVIPAGKPVWGKAVER